MMVQWDCVETWRRQDLGLAMTNTSTIKAEPKIVTGYMGWTEDEVDQAYAATLRHLEAKGLSCNTVRASPWLGAHARRSRKHRLVGNALYSDYTDLCRPKEDWPRTQGRGWYVPGIYARAKKTGTPAAQVSVAGPITLQARTSGIEECKQQPAVDMQPQQKIAADRKRKRESSTQAPRTVVDLSSDDEVDVSPSAADQRSQRVIKCLASEAELHKRAQMLGSQGASKDEQEKKLEIELQMIEVDKKEIAVEEWEIAIEKRESELRLKLLRLRRGGNA